MTQCVHSLVVCLSVCLFFIYDLTFVCVYETVVCTRFVWVIVIISLLVAEFEFNKVVETTLIMIILSYKRVILLLFRPRKRLRSIVMSTSVCVCVCLSVRDDISGTTSAIFA